MTAIKFGGELTFIGTTDAVAVRQLPLIRVPWLNEGPAPLMGRNGRPRTAVTLPGHNAGVRPRNAGKTRRCVRTRTRFGGRSVAFSERSVAFPFMCRSPLFAGFMPTNAKPNPPRACQHCGREFTPANGNAAAAQRFCSRSCGITAAQAHNRGRTTPWQERFWRFVPDPRPDGCWEWTGNRNAQGYGILMVSKSPVRTTPAHRASVTIHGGEIPDGMKVCHRCDNPPCVNPAHLFVGTQRENVEDMMRKGRWGGPVGEASNLARFSRETIDEVLDLKATTTLSNRAIGERVGMSKAHVRRIVTGEARKVA